MGDTKGRRVLVTGMGGQLGSLVAAELEKEPWVGTIVGIDADPPRRRLHRSEFHLIEPNDASRTRAVIEALDPHVLVHLAVWEPDARVSPSLAERHTREAAHSIFSAARECPSLQHVVVRSGIEVYGRGGHRRDVPDETAPTAPTSQYGRMLVQVERSAGDAFGATNADVTALRLAPVIGPHVPSPLGRLLRLPFVPFNMLKPPMFTVLHEADAARAFVLASQHTIGRPINVVGDGEISGFAAVRRSRHIPLPLFGPEWAVTRRIAHLFGAPVPEHVMEVLHNGRRASSERCEELLGWRPEIATNDVIDSLFSWEGVVRVPPKRAWEQAS
jgi:UDP-glucose 4-epimerase